MNIDPNIDDYPRLVPPEVVYEHKDSLKKKATVIPLFVKIASAAAAVALLFGIFWWRSATPNQSLMAELNPISPQGIVMETTDIHTESQLNIVVPRAAKSSPSKPQEKQPSLEHQDLLLLAGLQSRPPQPLPAIATDPAIPTPAFPEVTDEVFFAYQEDELYDDRSFLRKGFEMMTEGQYDSFGDMLKTSWRFVKVELAQLNESVSDGFDALKNNPKF